jgi:hypothetical protein
MKQQVTATVTALVGALVGLVFGYQSAGVGGALVGGAFLGAGGLAFGRLFGAIFDVTSAAAGRHWRVLLAAVAVIALIIVTWGLRF